MLITPPAWPAHRHAVARDTPAARPACALDIPARMPPQNTTRACRNAGLEPPTTTLPLTRNVATTP